jgi:hypothetical protein
MAIHLPRSPLIVTFLRFRRRDWGGASLRFGELMGVRLPTAWSIPLISRCVAVGRGVQLTRFF